VTALVCAILVAASMVSGKLTSELPGVLFIQAAAVIILAMFTDFVLVVISTRK
jgi:hypothetical protein